MSNLNEDLTPDFQDVAERAAQVDLLGRTSGAAQAAQEVAADKESTLEIGTRAVRSVSAAVGITKSFTRSLVEDDPNYNFDDHEEMLTRGIPQEYRNPFAATRSLAEAMMLRQDILQQMEDQRVLGAAGVRGVVAAGLAGIIDIDLPLTFISDGGYLAAKTGAALGKVGMSGTRVGMAVKTGVAGAEGATVAEIGNVVSRPTGSWEDIPRAGLTGMVFGGAIGAAVGKQLNELRVDETGSIGSKDPTDAGANKAAHEARKDFDESVADGQTGRYKYDSAAPGNKAFGFDDWEDGSGMSRSQFITKQTTAFNQSIGLSDTLQNAFPKNAAGRAAKKFYDLQSKSWIATDFDRLMTSNSPTAQATGYHLFESAAGVARNNKSASIMMDFYTGRVAGPVNTSYGPNFDLYLKENNIKNDYGTGRLASANIKKFNEAVYEELQNRRFGTTGDPSPAVKQMADAIDQGSAQAVQVYKGLEGEISVRGAEDLAPESGYFPQLWHADKFISSINRVADEMKVSTAAARKHIEQTLADEYTKLHGWANDISLKYAKAVTRRMMAQERGIDTNAVRLLNEEGLDFMRQFMIDNGFSAKEADTAITGLTGLDVNRGKDARLKKRKDIDLRANIPNTTLRLMDLVDTDIIGAWTKYSRRVGGSGATARQNIHKVDRKTYIDTILDEQTANGGGNLSRELLNDMFSYFDGGAVAGGVNPWVRRALQTTRLALLNGNGMTQMAEVGPQIAAVGLKNWKNSASAEIKRLLSGKDTPDSEFAKSFRPWVASIDGDHKLFKEFMSLDEMQANPGMWAEAGKWIDGAILRGSQLQGYTSGIFKVTQLEQNTVVRAMTYRLAEHFSGKSTISDARLYDMGLTDPNVIKGVEDAFKNIVEFTPDDVKMNFEDWDPHLRQEFVLAMQRLSGQVVQKNLRGEGSVWFSKTEGAVLTSLKTFAINAMQKQLVRNARIQDTASVGTFAYSLGAAAVVYSAKQIIAGNGDTITPEKLAKGAFMLNGMTGWLPMWTDPLASMLGMDDLRFNHYGAIGVGGDVMGIPPVLPTMNRIAHIPTSAAKLITGNGDNQDIYALQATPIIGNAYGFSYIFNALKDMNR